jgi:hypothetical protein
MTVVPFPRHKLHRPSSCDQGDTYCMICEGGLAWCETCHTGEGAMPTDCPQHKISSFKCHMIQSGKLDYTLKDGWVDLTAVALRPLRR